MKKAFSILGMIISVVVFLLGMLLISGAFTSSPSSASSASAYYKSGYASFGADFYTYVSNNAEEAASAARTVASNQRDLYRAVITVGGMLMIGAGLISFCAFGSNLGKQPVSARNEVTDMPKSQEKPKQTVREERPSEEPVFFEENRKNTPKLRKKKEVLNIIDADEIGDHDAEGEEEEPAFFTKDEETKPRLRKKKEVLNIIDADEVEDHDAEGEEEEPALFTKDEETAPKLRKKKDFLKLIGIYKADDEDEENEQEEPEEESPKKKRGLRAFFSADDDELYEEDTEK